MQNINEMSIIFSSKSENEAFARIVVSAFLAQIDPTVNELNDIKTAVSEAVTNAIIHGYGNGSGEIKMRCELFLDAIMIEIEDYGKGIENIKEAMMPTFTSCPEMERTGMGFTVMETLMDSLEVESKKDLGTKVIMNKKFDSLKE